MKFKKIINEAFWESSYGFVSKEAYDKFKEVSNLLNKELSEYDSLIDNLENNAVTDEEKEALESNTTYKTLISKYSDSYETINSLSRMFKEDLIRIEDNPYDNNILIDSTIYSVSDLYDLLNDLKRTRFSLDRINEKMKFKTRKNINEVFDNRTELIKKIDKFLYDNPEIEPPEGYVDSHSRNYDDLKSMYGDYVTTKFRYVKTSDLEDFAKTYLNESLKEDTVKISPEKFDEFCRVNHYFQFLSRSEYDNIKQEVGRGIDIDALVNDIKNDGSTTDSIVHIKSNINKIINEDTIKQNGKWVNKGKEGTHGKFKTKKAADAQRKAMFANGYKEELKEGVAGLYSDTEYKNKIEHDANYMLDQLSKLDLLKEGDEHTLDSSTIKIDIKWPKGQSPTSKLYVYTNDHLNSGGTICVRNMADYRYSQRLIDDLIKNIEKIKISPFLLSESRFKEELKESFSEESIVRQELLDDFDLELESFWIDDDMLIFTTSEGKKYVIHNPLDLDEAELAYAVYDVVESELDESINEDAGDNMAESLQNFISDIKSLARKKYSYRAWWMNSWVFPNEGTYKLQPTIYSNKGKNYNTIKFEFNGEEGEKYIKGFKADVYKTLDNYPELKEIITIKDSGLRSPAVSVMYKKSTNESISEAKKKDILKAIRTTSIPEGDIFQVGDAQTGWTAQIQNHGVDELDVKHNSHKTKSGAWGRIWKDKKLVKQFDGPLNIVRDEMVKFLKSKGLSENLDESLNEEDDMSKIDYLKSRKEELWNKLQEIQRKYHYKGYKTNYDYKIYSKEYEKITKEIDSLEAAGRGEELVTASKLTRAIKKVSGLETVKTRTSAIRGYRPVTGGSFEVYDYGGDWINVYFIKNYDMIPDIISSLTDMGFNIRELENGNGFDVSKYRNVNESLNEAYALDDLYKNNGVIHSGDFTIELGKLWNKKSKDYSGGFGKLTAVHNKDFSVDKTFKSPEKALAFFNKSISNKSTNESLNEDNEPMNTFFGTEEQLNGTFDQFPRKYSYKIVPKDVAAKTYKELCAKYEVEDMWDESLKESKEVLYVIKDKQGNQLSRPTPDDDELWDRVESMEARGKRGLKVVVYTDESLKEDIDEYDDEFYKGDDGNFYKELKSKSVYDSDGFTTDYTLYMKVIPDGSRADVEFVTVFGDSELYRPEDGYYDFECNDFKEALEWFNNYDGEEDFDESLKEARYSDAYDDNRKKQGWWYFTTHGVQPGSIPKDLNVIEIKDGKNSKGTQGTFVKLDGILNTSELKKFDMKEEVPNNESLEEDLVDPTEEDIESFEDLLKEFGFEVEGKGKTLFGNTHYQIIYPERTIDVSEIRSIATPLVDKLDVWEKEHEIPVTWNFGINKDGYLTAGMDLNKKWIPESLNQKSSNINEELYIKEAYNDYDPEDGWTEEDIELHKSIDWKARNYEEYDAGDSVTMEVVLYGLDEPEYAKVEMHKFLRSNPIYPPYYRPVMEKPFGMDIAYVGPMYDGNDYNNYQVHDRYETQETYDMLSDSLRVEKKELSLREKLNKLDHEGLDNNNYLDLVNLYEAVNDRLNAQEKQELKKLVDTSNDPEVISSYLNAKLNKDKNKGINNENN